MRWKAKSNSEAGEVLKMLAKQGEPLLKQLDNLCDNDGDIAATLNQPASNDANNTIDNAGRTAEQPETLTG